MFCVLSNFTISSIAPTLFGRNTENCFTSGPPIFDVVSGKSTGIRVAGRRDKIDAARRPLSHCRSFVGKTIYCRRPNVMVIELRYSGRPHPVTLSRFGLLKFNDLTWRTSSVALHSLPGDGRRE